MAHSRGPLHGHAVLSRAMAATLPVIFLLLMLAYQQALTGVFDPALADPVVTSGQSPTDIASGPPHTAESDVDYRRMANALPLFALGLLLVGLTRRPLLGLWVTTLAAALLYTVDALKVANLRAHLLPADALLLPQVMGNPELYLKYLDKAGATAPALALLAVTLVFVCEPPWPWLRRTSRALMIAGGLLLGYAIASAHPALADRYDDERLGFVAWTPDGSIERTGLVAGLVKLSGDTAWRVREPDAAFVRHVIDLHPGAATSPASSSPASTPLPVAVRPDIVIWQSESLFDTARLDSVVGRTEHLPAFAAFRARTLHGQMRVPTYAGGTVRTEFEAMTGYPLHAFGGVSYPYSALAQRPLLSLPRQLRDQGYSTVAIHPFDGNFWSRNRAFVHMGFDRFQDIDHFDTGDIHGFYVGDDALLRHVASELAQPHERPLFLFAISMENHGPWHARPGIDPDALARIEVPYTLSPDAAVQMRHYLYHLHRADRMFAELMALADARERHTIVLFYGDHLPGLDSAFGQLGFLDGKPAWEQPVPFALFDNRRDGAGAAGGTLRSYHLASMVLDAAGMRENPHFRVLSADRERHGRTGLVDLLPDPALDYDHAIANLSWHYYRQTPDTPTPDTVPDTARATAR
jgi:hypothetical protein